MIIGLVLTICTVLSGGLEDCDSQNYVLETYPGATTPALQACTDEMLANRQTRDDRYLSCQWVDEALIQKSPHGGDLSVKQQLAELEEAAHPEDWK